MDFKKFIGKTEGSGGGFLSWSNFRDLSLILVCLVLAYRLAVSEIAIDLSGFAFTDLLSLILAISAIVLSAAFYFKADESSKSFYNNSYEFTKNISELLGRIEERFGAQLVSINKGYDELSNKLALSPIELNKAKEEQQKEREVIRRTQDEYQKIIDDLMVKAKIDDAEMTRVRAHMTELAREADNAKLELARYTALLDDDAANPLAMSDESFVLLKELLNRHFGPAYRKVPPMKIIERFDQANNYGLVGQSLLKELGIMGLINEGSLNARGAQFFRRLL